MSDGSILEEGGVVLYTLGDLSLPRGPRSALSMWLMRYTGIEFRVVDVLADERARLVAEQRSGMRLFPQIFVDGEFIGSGEVVAELNASGFFRAFRDGTSAPEGAPVGD
jgi:monothiol glutaredoxin